MQYQLSRVVIGPALHVLGRPRVTGLEYVPASGPAILASNHLSFIDSMYLPLVIPRPVVFPAKAEYFSAKGPLGRLWAAYLRSTNQLEMDRSDSKSATATLEAAAGILRAGDLFGFYPEGTRSPDGRLYRGRAGLGWLALNTGAPPSCGASSSHALVSSLSMATRIRNTRCLPRNASIPCASAARYFLYAASTAAPDL